MFVCFRLSSTSRMGFWKISTPTYSISLIRYVVHMREVHYTDMLMDQYANWLRSLAYNCTVMCYVVRVRTGQSLYSCYHQRESECICRDPWFGNTHTYKCTNVAVLIFMLMCAVYFICNWLRVWCVYLWVCMHVRVCVACVCIDHHSTAGLMEPISCSVCWADLIVCAGIGRETCSSHVWVSCVLTIYHVLMNAL